MCIESREIHTSCSGKAGHQPINYSTNVTQSIKAFSYKLQTIHKLEKEDNDRRLDCVKRCLTTTKTTRPPLTTFGSVTRLFFIRPEE